MFLEFSKTGIRGTKIDENQIDFELNVRGTNGQNGNRHIQLNGVDHVNTTMNGLGLVIFDSTLSVVSTGVFNIYSDTTARNALISRLQNLQPDQLAVFATGGSTGIRSNTAIDDEFERLGSWKWLGTSFLNRKPRSSYAAICHGTYGFVYESVQGTALTSPVASIVTTFADPDELGKNSYGIPLYQDSSIIDTDTVVYDEAIDFESYLVVNCYMVNDGLDTANVEVEFFDVSDVSLQVYTITCDSAYLWQHYRNILDIPVGSTRVQVRTVHNGTGTPKVGTIQIGKHNGFSPVPTDTIFSTRGIYSDAVSYGVHGYQFYDTDWATETQTNYNLHRTVAFEQDILNDVIWKDQTFTTDLQRMNTQSLSSTELESLDFMQLDTGKTYFCSVWVRRNAKTEGTVGFGVKAFDSGQLSTPLVDSTGTNVTDPEMVTIPSTDFDDNYKIMYFWILPRVWDAADVQEFSDSVSNYYESIFGVDHNTNSKVLQTTSNTDSIKLFVNDNGNVSQSDVRFALPIVKEVSLLSFSTSKLEALNYSAIN